MKCLFVTMMLFGASSALAQTSSEATDAVWSCLRSTAERYAVEICDPATELVGAVFGACQKEVSAARTAFVLDKERRELPIAKRLELGDRLFSSPPPQIQTMIVEKRIAQKACR